MDFHSMKRKELQALCKKHGIPANLTNLEMANKLASLLKEKEKPVPRGKSCLRSTAEQPSETLSDGVNRQSKKVKFSPENETIEFVRSEVKSEKLGRGARRRSMSVVKIEGIASAKNVGNSKFSRENLRSPIRLTRSRNEKVTNEVENRTVPDAAETKRVKRGSRSVAQDEVSMVEARVTRRYLENKEVENKKEVADDACMRKNPTERASRKKSMKIGHEVSEIETKEVNADVGLKKNQSQRSSRSRVVKSGAESQEESQEGEALLEDNGVVETQKVVRRSKRNTEQNEACAELNLGLGEVEVARRARTKRRRDQLSEDVKVTNTKLKTSADLETVLQVEELSIRPSRYSNRRQSIMLHAEKLEGNISQAEDENKAPVQSRALEENVMLRKSSTWCKSKEVSETNLAENVSKNKPPRSGKIDQELEERNTEVEGSSPVGLPPKKSARNGAKAQKNLVTVRTSKAVTRNKLPGTTRTSNAQSEPIEEIIPVVEQVLLNSKTTKPDIARSRSSPVTNIGEVSSDNTDEETQGETHISGIESGAEKDLNNSKLSQDYEVNEDYFDSDNLVRLESEVELDRVKNMLPSEASLGEEEHSQIDQPDCIDEELDLQNKSVMVENNYIKIQASDSVKQVHKETQAKLSENLDLEELGVDENNDQGKFTDLSSMSHDRVYVDEDKFDPHNLALLESEVELDRVKDVVPPEASVREEYSKIDQPDCIAKSAEHLDLQNELEMVENDLKIQASDYVKQVHEETQAKLDENLELEELQVDENNDHRKFTDLSNAMPHDVEFDAENSCNCEDEHFAEPEVVGDNSDGEKNIYSAVEATKRHETERSVMVGEVSEFLIGKEQPCLETEGDGDMEHSVEGYSAPCKCINSTKDHFEIIIEEPADSSVIGISARKEVILTKMEVKISDEIESFVHVEPENGEQLKCDVENECHIIAQDNGSALNKKFDFVNEEVEVEVPKCDDYYQNRTTSKVEQQQQQQQEVEAEISPLSSKSLEFTDSSSRVSTAKSENLKEKIILNNSSEVEVVGLVDAADTRTPDKDVVESVRSPTGTITNTASNWKDQQHSTRVATPISVSNEIKSIMMINLNKTPTPEFGRKHSLMMQEVHSTSASATVEQVEILNNVMKENTSGCDHHSPLPLKNLMDNSDSPCTSSGNFEMERTKSSMCTENQITSQEGRNSGEQRKIHSFLDGCSIEPEKGEGTETEFPTNSETVTAESERHPFQATSPLTTICCAECEDVTENVQSPCVTGRDDASSMEQKHSMTATPLSISNEIKSLMLINLTPASDLGKVHNSALTEALTTSAFGTVGPVENLDKVKDERTSEVHHHSPFPQDDHGTSTPLTVSNEIKSLMLINLDRTPASELGKVHNSALTEALTTSAFGTVGAVEDLEKVKDESTSEVLHHSPFPQDDHGTSTPLTVSNEIKSLMLINLDRTPASELGKVHNLKLQEAHQTPAFRTVELVEDLNKVKNESTSKLHYHSPFPQEDHGVADESSNPPSLCEELKLKMPKSGMWADNLTVSQEAHDFGEKVKSQSLRDDCSTEPQESEGTEIESTADYNTASAERDTQPFEATPQITSGRAEHLGNGISNIEVSPTELRLLFDNKEHEGGMTLNTKCSISLPSRSSDSLTQFKHDDEDTDVDLCVSNNVYTEEETRNGVTQEELSSPTDFEGGDIQVIGSYDNNFADTTCVEIRNSPSISAYKASASKSIHTINLLEEENEGIGEMGPDKYKMAWELSEGTSTALDNLNTEKKDEDLVNISRQLERDVTKVDEGMFDDLDGHEMEMVHEMFQAEEADSPDLKVGSSSNSDHFSSVEKALMEDNSFKEEEIENKEKSVEDMANFVSDNASNFECLTSSQKFNLREAEANESECYKRDSKDTVQCFVESNEYTRKQNLSQASQSWSPDPEFGHSQDRLGSNMFSSWELNLFSEGEATKSTTVVSKIPITKQDEKNFVYENQSAKDHHLEVELADVSVNPLDSFSDGHKTLKGIDLAITDAFDLDVAEDDSLLGENITQTDVEMTVDEATEALTSDLLTEVAPSESVDLAVRRGSSTEELATANPLNKGVVMFEDKGLTVSSLYTSEEDNTEIPFSMECKHVEASDEVAFEITPEEIKLKVETGVTFFNKKSLDHITQCTDYEGENTKARNINQDFTPNATGYDDIVDSSFGESQSFEFANSTVKEGSAAKDSERNVDLFGKEEKGEVSAFETNSTILKTGNRSSLIQWTPKKLASNFDMKENAAGIKRENLGNVTAKSTAKRRALMELPK